MPSPSPHRGPVDEDDAGRPFGGYTMWISIAAVLALLGGWVYVLFVYDPGLLIDELPDTTFPNRAEQICAVAREQFDKLPMAQTARNASERADTVARSNVIFANMITELRGELDTVPEAQRDGVTEWVDDWAVYLGNRERYVENLRADENARFLESTKGKETKGITQAINSFAQVNRMESCSTPGDLS